MGLVQKHAVGVVSHWGIGLLPVPFLLLLLCLPGKAMLAIGATFGATSKSLSVEAINIK